MGLLNGKKDKFDAMVENAGKNRDFKNENVWFDWGDKDEHVIRIVGEYKWFRNHWINASPFSPFKLMREEAFSGDAKLPKNIRCSDWDFDTETNDDMGTCPVCKLRKIANDAIAKQGKLMSPEIKDFMEQLANKCRPTNTFMVKIIDRENPYVADGVKGFKILRMTKDLLCEIKKISNDLGVDLSSDEHGFDIKITRVKNGQKTTYKASPVYKGMSVKETPLTEEELNYRVIDLSKFCGKSIEDTGLFARYLVDDVANFWDDDKTSSTDTGDEPAPF